MPQKSSRPLIAVAVSGALALGNAVAADQFCVAHPSSPTCDDPRAPGPEAPHEQREQVPGPMGPVGQAQASMWVGATGATGPAAPADASLGETGVRGS
jgi:hypothetical protein